jgi:hypothetical protein
MADDLKSKAAELVQKVLTVGVGSIFLTEQSLRSLFSELKLPKEMLSGVLDSASKTKNEFLAKLSSDMLERVSDKIDVQALVRETLEKNEIDLHIKLSFRPKGGDRGGESA